jgi:BlaI family penicillinase repressor
LFLCRNESDGIFFGGLGYSEEVMVKEEVRVTNKEWYVMNCLWEESPRTLMQLVPLLAESVGWSKSTCATMVRRMTEKKLIGYKENGKTKYFFPKVKKEDVVVQETRDFLQRIYDGSIGMMMSALVDQNNLSRKDIQELQEILKEAEDKADY